MISKINSTFHVRCPRRRRVRDACPLRNGLASHHRWAAAVARTRLISAHLPSLRSQIVFFNFEINQIETFAKPRKPDGIWPKGGKQHFLHSLISTEISHHFESSHLPKMPDIGISFILHPPLAVRAVYQERKKLTAQLFVMLGQPNHTNYCTSN